MKFSCIEAYQNPIKYEPYMSKYNSLKSHGLTAVKCWVQGDLTRESDGSPSEGTKGTWLQLIRSCALCSRFQSESRAERNPEGIPREGIKMREGTLEGNGERQERG